MFRVIFYKRLILLLGSIVMICVSSVSVAQDNGKPFVRLATYWDALGRVNAISADERWVVIYDVNNNMSRLVEVATGEVYLTNREDNSIRFSPRGAFVVLLSAGKQQTIWIIDLNTNKQVAEVPGVTFRFSEDESLVMISTSGQAEANTTVVDTKTGTTKLQIRGAGRAFSPDSRLIGIDDFSQLTTRLIDIATGKSVFEFPTREYKEGQIRNTHVLFSPDGQLVAIHQLNNIRTYVIDIATWKILYDVYGFATFSSDSRFLKMRQSDGPAAPNVLLEARTGKQLDKVYGEMWFSDDSKLLYRMDSTNCAYRGYMQVIELSSMKVLMDIRKCVGLDAVENQNVVEVYDEDIIAPQIHQFIDMGTGKVIWQVETRNVDMINLDQHLVLMTHHGWQTIENFETGEVFASEQEITLSPSKQYAFASNGLYVDLYGATDLRADTMPAPRIGGGMVQAPKGKLIVYPTQETSHTIEEESLNPFMLSVLGKSDDEKWLYVTYTVYQPEVRRKAVWIVNQNLTVIEDWHDVPLLDASDPLAFIKNYPKHNAPQ